MPFLSRPLVEENLEVDAYLLPGGVCGELQQKHAFVVVDSVGIELSVFDAHFCGWMRQEQPDGGEVARVSAFDGGGGEGDAMRGLGEAGDLCAGCEKVRLAVRKEARVEQKYSLACGDSGVGLEDEMWVEEVDEGSWQRRGLCVTKGFGDVEAGGDDEGTAS